MQQYRFPDDAVDEELIKLGKRVQEHAIEELSKNQDCFDTEICVEITVTQDSVKLLYTPKITSKKSGSCIICKESPNLLGARLITSTSKTMRSCKETIEEHVSEKVIEECFGGIERIVAFFKRIFPITNGM
ncbi:hypothetical protein ACFLY0_00540 [Patescibacteria group bacterium]